VAPTVQGEAVSIDPGVEAGPVIWTARLRIGHVVIFQASGSRAFRAAASIAAAAVVDLAVIASVVEASVAAVVNLAAADLAGSAAAAAGSGGVDEDNAWNFPVFFLEKLKPQTNH